MLGVLIFIIIVMIFKIIELIQEHNSVSLLVEFQKWRNSSYVGNRLPISSPVPGKNEILRDFLDTMDLSFANSEDRKSWMKEYRRKRDVQDAALLILFNHLYQRSEDSWNYRYAPSGRELTDKGAAVLYMRKSLSSYLVKHGLISRDSYMIPNQDDEKMLRIYNEMR